VPSLYAGEVEDRTTRTAREVAAGVSSWLPLQGVAGAVLGNVPRGPWSLAIYGPPAAGKSSLLLLLAQAFAQAAGAPVLYVAVEEGTGTSMAEKLRHLEVRSDAIHLACLLGPGAMLERARELGARLLVLDSLTVSHLSAEDAARLMREGGLSFAASLHETKGGSASGPVTIVHWADIVVRVEPGGWKRTKSRFSGVAEGEVRWTRKQ
jgi:predicted ATP-dependent serine protease